jgi:GH25 family lysozyme M1 (1,4-beta-N-acetylmuramidase)
VNYENLLKVKGNADEEETRMNFLNLVQSAAGKVKGVATLLSGLTKTQAIIAGVATVTAVGGVGTGGYFLYDHFHQPEPIVADVVISTEVAEEPTEEVVAVEEVVTEETEAAEPETVTLVGSSIEKDLKIKIQDESSKNVKGQPFEITIKADKKKAKSTTYSDDDKDGIIYIKSIDAGKYDVSLNEIDGYISKENSYKVTVKDKIEYTKVDVKDEIKSAAEVAPAEDAEVDNVEVEAVIQDTVETVDSTCTPSKVGAGDVDTSNFPKASVGGSTKVDIAQAAVTASAKRVGYHATGNEGETVPSTATKEPKSSETQQPSEGGTDKGDNTGNQGGNSQGGTTGSGENQGGSSTGGTEEPKPKPNPEPSTYEITIVHMFYKNDGKTKADKADEKETVTVAKDAKTVSSAKTYDGYKASNGTTFTIQDGAKEYTIMWVATAADKVTYKVTHNFFQADGKTKAEESKSEDITVDATATEIQASSYEAQGYKLVEGSTKIKVAAGTTAYTLNWVKAAAAASASVTAPQTAALYNSTINNANAIGLTATLTDAGNIITNITWTSSNEKVVKVSNGAKTGCTLTAVGKGSATVTGIISYLSKPGDTKTTANDKKITCTVTVNDFTGNTTTQLKDKSGRLLYKDSECKKPATVADYNANGTYYTEPVYTGWQTIDGKVYYYTSNHQRVTGSQVISGITYNFGSDGALQQGSGKNGIDVSSHQGNIDWASVKAAGINFAIIRVGYRGSQTGALVEDSCFKKNIQGATANGINVGVYFFTQATTEAEAVEEASMALTLCSGYNLSYPIFVDTENGSGAARANGLDKGSRTACVAAFCKTIANGGRKAGVYASKSWYNNKIDASAFSNYFIWVAQYNTTCNYKGKYNMWQYSSKGSVPGIKGNVDVNIAY